MKEASRFVLGVVAIAAVTIEAKPISAQERADFPSDLAAAMSEYASRRNLALVEFNRVYLEKFVALETRYRQENRDEAAATARNKIVQLRKEIERLRAAAAGGFALLEARYGSDEQGVDCLEPLLGQIRENQLRITVKPAAIGLKRDPHFGVRKTLTVKYYWNGEVKTASAMDGQLMALPETGDGD